VFEQIESALVQDFAVSNFLLQNSDGQRTHRNWQWLAWIVEVSRHSSVSNVVTQALVGSWQEQILELKVLHGLISTRVVLVDDCLAVLLSN
jgi:hypothetical protein